MSFVDCKPTKPLGVVVEFESLAIVLLFVREGSVWWSSKVLLRPEVAPFYYVVVEVVSPLAFFFNPLDS